MVNFIALSSYNSGIKERWMRGREHWDWARTGMWTDELITREEEDESLRTAREWEEKYNGR